MTARISPEFRVSESIRSIGAAGWKPKDKSVTAMAMGGVSGCGLGESEGLTGSARTAIYP